MNGAKYWNLEFGWCMLRRPLNRTGSIYTAWSFHDKREVMVRLDDPQCIILCMGTRRLGKELMKV